MLVTYVGRRCAMPTAFFPLQSQLTQPRQQLRTCFLTSFRVQPYFSGSELLGLYQIYLASSCLENFRNAKARLSMHQDLR